MTNTINSQREQINSLKKANARAIQTIRTQRENKQSTERIPRVKKQGFLTSIEYPNGRLYDNNSRGFRDSSQRESRATLQQQSINLDLHQPQIRSSRRRPQSSNPRGSYQPAQAQQVAQGQGTQTRAHNNDTTTSNFQGHYSRLRQTISYYEGGDNVSVSGSSLFQNYKFGKVIINTADNNQQIKRIKQQEFDVQSVQSQQVRLPKFKDILIMQASDEDSPKKAQNSDARKQNSKRTLFQSQRFRSNSQVIDDKEIRHKVLDCKKTPSQSSMSQHSIKSLKLNDTEQIKRAIDHNTSSLIKTLKKYFMQKALESVRAFQDEEEKENELRQRRRKIIKNPSHCTHESHRTSQNESSHSDHSHKSQSSSDHDNHSHSSASLKVKKEKKSKDELDKLKKSLKYLDLLIDEYVDMPLIRHQMNEWQAKVATQKRSQYPPKPFIATKSARGQKISEILSENPSTKIQLKFVDEEIDNENDYKINQLRDHFTYDTTKDKAHLEIYLGSIDRQLDANQGFKKIYDKSFVGLHKTIATLNDSLGYKLILLKDKMKKVKSVRDVSGYCSSATQRSVSSSNSRMRHIQGRMSTFYKQNLSMSRSQVNESNSDSSRSDSR